jgi:hypothetical protein
MVVTSLPATCVIGMLQERTGTLFTCTVQAPHWATPHPNLVPVSCKSSRNTHSSGVLGAASVMAAFPLTLNEVVMRKFHKVSISSV